MANRPNFGPSAERQKAMYERMLLIRRMEERLAADFAAGNLPGAVHLYIGQEAVAVGVCEHLDDADMIASTHRGHGHFLAKGGDPNTMMAEIWGKRNGVCKGMGGSMHVADVSKGILGANGIVGAGLAITAGAAFGAKLDGKGKVAVVFFGDGASNQGSLMETLNIATLWRLPMIYVCENNTFSEFSPGATVTAGEIVNRAKAFGIPTAVVDGNDVNAVWRAAADAVERARAGQGPSFIEARTYRIHGHLEAEDGFLGGQTYREASEIEAWRKKCPIDRLASELTQSGVCKKSEIEAIGARIGKVVGDAVEFSEAGEPADPELAFDIMFVNQRA